MNLIQRASQGSPQVTPPFSPSQVRRVGATIFRPHDEQTLRSKSRDQLAALYVTNPWIRLALDTVASRRAAARWTLLLPTSNSRSVRRRVKFALASNVSDTDDLRERDKITKHLIESGEAEEVIDHPFLRMINNGITLSSHLDLPGYEIERLSQIAHDVHGEIVLILGRDPSSNIPVCWFPVPAHWVEPPNDVHPETFLVRLGMGQDEHFNPRDVVWYRVPALTNPYDRGVGVVSSLDRDTEIDERFANYLASFLKNRARPDILIMGPGIDAESAPLMKDQWKRDMGGSIRQAVTHFLGVPKTVNAKDVIVKDLQKTAADLEASALRDQEKRIILQVCRVPPDIIGDTTSSNRSTAYQAERSLRTNKIVPELESWRRFLQSRFFSDFGGRTPEYMGEDRLVVSYRLPPLVDQEARVELMKSLPYAFTEEDIREVSQLPRLPGSERRRFVPVNVTVHDIIESVSRGENQAQVVAALEEALDRLKGPEPPSDLPSPPESA